MLLFSKGHVSTGLRALDIWDEGVDADGDSGASAFLLVCVMKTPDDSNEGMRRCFCHSPSIVHDDSYMLASTSVLLFVGVVI